jgi:hypothetical protein
MDVMRFAGSLNLLPVGGAVKVTDTLAYVLLI